MSDMWGEPMYLQDMAWFEGDTWGSDFGFGGGIDYAFWGDRIADLPGFGTTWGSFSQLAEAQYEQMVYTTFAAANQASADRTAAQQYLNDDDPSNDYLAAAILAGNSNVGIQLPNGTTLFGTQAVAYLASLNPSIDLSSFQGLAQNSGPSGTLQNGIIAYVTVYANGSMSDPTLLYNPFAVFHNDQTGQDIRAIWNQQQGQYVPYTGTPEERMAVINSYREMAQLARSQGNETDAQFYDQMARFYGVTDEERATAMPGISTISREWPGNAVSSPTDLSPAERELADLRAQRALALAQWEAIDAGRDPNGSYTEQQFQVYYSEYQSYNGSWPTSSRLRSVEAMNSQRVANGQAVMGAVSIVNTALTWIATGQRMYQLGDWRAREEQLVRQIVSQTTYGVPPRPEHVAGFMDQFYGLDTNARAALQNRLTQLSHAFWGY